MNEYIKKIDPSTYFLTSSFLCLNEFDQLSNLKKIKDLAKTIQVDEVFFGAKNTHCINTIAKALPQTTIEVFLDVETAFQQYNLDQYFEKQNEISKTGCEIVLFHDSFLVDSKYFEKRHGINRQIYLDYLKSQNCIQKYTLPQIAHAQQKLNEWANFINSATAGGHRLSPLEKFYTAYQIVTQFPYSENNQNPVKARGLIDVLACDCSSIVCAGYSALLCALCKKLGIACVEQYSHISHADSNIKSLALENNHQNCCVRIIDPKYNINEVFHSDPCFDAYTHDQSSICHSLMHYGDAKKLLNNQIKTYKITSKHNTPKPENYKVLVEDFGPKTEKLLKAQLNPKSFMGKIAKKYFPTNSANQILEKFETLKQKPSSLTIEKIQSACFVATKVLYPNLTPQQVYVQTCQKIDYSAQLAYHRWDTTYPTNNPFISHAKFIETINEATK